MSELSNNGKNEIERALAAVAGEQRVRLLGPYRLVPASVGPGGTFADGFAVLLGEFLPIGATVIKMFPLIIEPFDGGLQLMLGVGDHAPDDTVLTVSSHWLGTSQRMAGDDAQNTAQDAAAPAETFVFVLGPAAKLAAINQNGSSITVGEADIYALIAEPVE